MNAIVKYFNAEKWACSVGILLGVLSLAAAIYFFISIKKPFYTGMAWPLTVVGIFFLVICVSIVIRSPKDIQRVSHYSQVEKQKIQSEEIPRMEKVIRNFDVIMIVEGIFILVGLLLLLLQVNVSWKGAGLGILIEALVLLIFDFLAKARANEYMDFLKGL